MGEHNCYHHDAAECTRRKAYELWEKDGHKQGREVDYWLKAEKAVKDTTNK